MQKNDLNKLNANVTTKQCYFNDMDKEKLIKLTKGKVSGFVEKARKRRELKNNGVLDDVIKCPMCGEYGEKGLDNRYYCNNCERDY